MNILLSLSVTVAIIVIVVDFIGWWLLKDKTADPQQEPEEWPAVALLIAARNEEHNLARCLRAVEKLDYPTDRLSVWIGNDQSTDHTRELALSFCRRNTRWQVVDIVENGSELKGKANVLAQLSKAARSSAEYYFITDADVVVSENWVKHMLTYFNPKLVLLSGTTLVEGKTWFARMQRMDWVKGQALVGAFSSLPREGKTVSAKGNNMAVKREAYEAVGGYDKIPFSVTEDFELNRQIQKIGYSSLQLSTPGTKAYTLPVPDLVSLLQQRKRWMKGALQLPKPIIIIFLIQAVFFPAILVVLFYYPILGLTLLSARWLVQALLIWRFLVCLKEPPTVPFLGYELYNFILNVSQLIFYILPVPVMWKGRKY